MNKSIYVSLFLIFICVVLAGCAVSPVDKNPTLVKSVSASGRETSDIKTLPASTIEGTNTSITPKSTHAAGEAVSDPENTDTPSVKASKTPTILPKLLSTAFSKPASNADGLLGSPLIIQMTLGGEVFLQDINTGEIRSLSPEIMIYDRKDFLGWSNTGCSFLYRKMNRDIIEVNLQGEKIRTLFSADKLASQGSQKCCSNITPALTQNNVAFIAAEGDTNDLISHPDAGDHLKIENVFISKANSNLKPIQVSEKGGAWFFQWSPDGQKIAYTDYDPSGRFQLYIASINSGNRIQLSNYEEEDRALGGLFWSPNGRFLLKSGFYFHQDVDLFDIEQKSSLTFQKVDAFWWEPDNVLALWEGQEIRWVSPEDGKVLKKERANKLISEVSPFGSTQEFGCFSHCFGQGSNHVMTYNLITRSFYYYPNAKNVLDSIGWSAAPASFQTERNCKK